MKLCIYIKSRLFLLTKTLNILFYAVLFYKLHYFDTTAKSPCKFFDYFVLLCNKVIDSLFCFNN